MVNIFNQGAFNTNQAGGYVTPGKVASTTGRGNKTEISLQESDENKEFFIKKNADGSYHFSVDSNLTELLTVGEDYDNGGFFVYTGEVEKQENAKWEFSEPFGYKINKIENGNIIQAQDTLTLKLFNELGLKYLLKKSDSKIKLSE